MLDVVARCWHTDRAFTSSGFDLTFASVHRCKKKMDRNLAVVCVETGLPQCKDKTWFLQASCTVIMLSSVVRNFIAVSQNVTLQPTLAYSVTIIYVD